MPERRPSRRHDLMDQGIESFLIDVLALAGGRTGRGPRGCPRRSSRLRGDLPGAGTEQADEGRGRSRMPRVVSRSRPRGNAGAQRNADRRALEAGAQYHRPAGTVGICLPGPSCAKSMRNCQGCHSRGACGTSSFLWRLFRETAIWSPDFKLNSHPFRG